MKLSALDKNGFGTNMWDWVGHFHCEFPGELESKIIEGRDRINFLGGVSDDEACYSYDEWALIELDGHHYLLTTSGCSCPSPSETWYVNIGPSTLSEIKEKVLNGDYSGYTLPAKQRGDFMELFEKAEKGELND